jgi:hypothetical protein
MAVMVALTHHTCSAANRELKERFGPRKGGVVQSRVTQRMAEYAMACNMFCEANSEDPVVRFCRATYALAALPRSSEWQQQLQAPLPAPGGTRLATPQSANPERKVMQRADCVLTAQAMLTLLACIKRATPASAPNLLSKIEALCVPHCHVVSLDQAHKLVSLLNECGSCTFACTSALPALCAQCCCAPWHLLPSRLV